MPDLALGCLMKPFTAEDVHRSLAMAEDMLRGRETLRPKLPDNLTIYETEEEPPSLKPATSLQSVRFGPARALDLGASALGNCSEYDKSRSCNGKCQRPRPKPCPTEPKPELEAEASPRRRDSFNKTTRCG